MIADWCVCLAAQAHAPDELEPPCVLCVVGHTQGTHTGSVSQRRHESQASHRTHGTCTPTAHNVLPHENPEGGAALPSLSATLLVCVSLLALATICSFQTGVASTDSSSVRVG